MEGAQIGPYRVLGDLGSGGMGKVYLAEVTGHAPHLDDGTRVALKVIHPHLLETPGFFKRFLREAEIGRSVEHDNVVRCFDCDALMVEGHQQHFLVMEYVEGQTLRDLLSELGRVPEGLCRHIGREIAKGLIAIHAAGVIHRDLKPENVLITEEHVVKVMDLGVARLQDEVVRLSQTGAFVGSLEYASPEQFRGGGKDVDARSDLHALGVMLYELSTGQHPYRTDDVSSTLKNVVEGEARRVGEVNPQLSPFIEEVIHTLAARNPGERFSSAEVLLGTLEEGEKSKWWKERAQALRIQTKRPLRRIRIPRETALYGRDDDLANLHALYDKAKAGDGKVLLIEGEAGIGKTRLVDEFVGRLRQEGEDVNFLFGSYPPGGAATATGAFSTAYREHFGEADLGETLEPYLEPTRILIPAFAALLKGETTPPGAEPLTQDSMQTVFVHATRGLAAERTTIVLIDDLHFAPEGGRALFSSLAMAAPGHRILLLGTMRPGVPVDWTANVERLDHAARVALSRLGPKDLFRLLKDSFRSERLAEALGLQISVKCDGNPFFAFEIIRGLRDGQFIARQPDGTWVTTKVIEDIQVPSSVQDLVSARIADLEPEERDLVDVASCCGFGFDPAVLAHVVGVRRIPVLKMLSQIEREHRLVRSAGREFVFDHHQVQEAIYGSLPEMLREEYHAAIAAALEARSGAAETAPEELDGALGVDLCTHFLKGRQGERALRYLDGALDHLQAGYLNDQAIALADRALRVPDLLQGEPRMRVVLRQIERMSFLGRRRQQEEGLAEARALADALGDQAALAKVEGMLGSLMWNTSRLDEASVHLEHSLAIYREIGDRRGEAETLMSQGIVAWLSGRHDEAREQCERSLALAREIGERQTEAMATGNLGLVAASLGRHEEAKDHLERSRAAAPDSMSRAAKATVVGNLGGVSRSLGRYEDARDHYERYLEISREIGNRQGEAVALVNLGALRLRLGDRIQARQALDASLAICREIGARFPEGFGLRALGSVADEEGDAALARQLARQSLELRRKIGHEDGVADSLLFLAELHERAGETAEAREALEEAADVLRRQHRKGGLAHASALLARLPEGDVEAAETALEDAGEDGNTPETRYLLWKATGKPEHLDEAKRLLDHLVRHAPEECRASMQKDVRLNREIRAAWAEHGGVGE